MDWNIWSSSYDQDVHDDSNFEQPGSRCDNNFGYGHDLIEEEALNEKYCIQVLNILIPNADAEIEELEMELLSLQNELQPEPKKWLEICCGALSEKINQLDGSLRSLRNEGANATEIQHQSHKPAETLEEILKALRKDYFQETANTNVKGSSPGSQKLAADHFKEEKISAVSHSDGTQDKETKEHSFTTEDGQFVGKISLGSEEKRCIPDPLSNVDIKDCCKDASRDATEANPIPVACCMTLCSVLEPEEKAPDSSKSAKELLTRKLWRSLNMGVIRRQPSQSDRIKILGMPDKNVSRNYIVGRSQVITTDRGHILNSFSSTCKGNIIPKEVKQENAIVKDVSANAFRLETGIKARKECLGSKWNALQQGRSENLDLDLKLCSLAPKPSARDGELSDEEKPHKIDLKPEIFANICNSNTSLPLKTKVDRKRKPEPETCGGRELSDNPREVILDSSSKFACKWQWKSSTGVDGASLNRPLNAKITQRAVQPGRHEVNKLPIVPCDNKNSISELPITTDIKDSTVNMELPSSDRVAMENESQKHPRIGRSYSINSHDRKTSTLLRSEISSLEGLTVKDLRAIAKRHNLRGYSKLTKAAFIEALKQLLDD